MKIIKYTLFFDIHESTQGIRLVILASKNQGRSFWLRDRLTYYLGQGLYYLIRSSTIRSILHQAIRPISTHQWCVGYTVLYVMKQWITWSHAAT